MTYTRVSTHSPDKERIMLRKTPVLSKYIKPNGKYWKESNTAQSAEVSRDQHMQQWWVAHERGFGWLEGNPFMDGGASSAGGKLPDAGIG